MGLDYSQWSMVPLHSSGYQGLYDLTGLGYQRTFNPKIRCGSYKYIYHGLVNLFAGGLFQQHW